MSLPSAPSMLDSHIPNEGRETTVPLILGVVRRPFKDNPTPDVYHRAIDRVYDVDPARYEPRIAELTTWRNLIPYSEDFSNAAWIKDALTVSPAYATNPSNGAQTVSRVVETSANGAHSLSATLVPATAGAYTFSVFVAPAERTILLMYSTDFAGGRYFDLSSGIVSSVVGNAPAGASISRAYNGLLRCSITVSLSTASGSLQIYLSNGSGFTYVGDTAKGLSVWGAQVVAGSLVGPYISTTSVARTILAADIDSDLPFAYLTDESDIEVGTTDLGHIRKSFTTIPGDQVTTGSKSLTKQTPGNQVANTWSVRELPLSTTQVTTGILYTTGFFLADYRVFAPLKACGLLTVGRATAGTATFSYKASTTAAFAYNASAATINGLINGLAAVISDGLTVSVTNLLNSASGGTIVIALTVGTTTSSFTLNPAGLTTSTSAKAFTTVNSSVLQAVQIADHVTITGHGFTVAGSFFVTQGVAVSGTTVYGGYVLAAGQWGVFDANTIQLAHDALGTTGAINYTNPLVYAAPFLRNWIPGQTIVPTEITERYYLPGVTADVATVADIPIQQTESADAALIDAMLGGGGEIVVAFDGPVQHRGRIHKTITATIDLADV